MQAYKVWSVLLYTSYKSTQNGKAQKIAQSFCKTRKYEKKPPYIGGK